MTTPAPPQQPGQPPPQQQDDAALDSAALALAVAALLLGTGAAAAAASGGVAAMVAALRLRFALSSAAWHALGSVLTLVTQHPHPVTGVIGPASAQVSRMNAARRAQYVLAASKRVLGAAREARAKGESVTQAITGQLATERRYFEQHQAAMWDRATAAGRVDMEAAVHGDLLGWLSVKDRRVSPECAAASGKNFYASRIPDIGFPGSVHPSCRCLPVAPWPGGKLLPSRGARFARAA